MGVVDAQQPLYDSAELVALLGGECLHQVLDLAQIGAQAAHRLVSGAPPDPWGAPSTTAPT